MYFHIAAFKYYTCFNLWNAIFSNQLPAVRGLNLCHNISLENNIMFIHFDNRKGLALSIGFSM